MRRRGRRAIGLVLILESLLAITAQIVLSTLPFGIGEPMIRVPFWSTLAQMSGTLASLAAVSTSVYFLSRKLDAQGWGSGTSRGFTIFSLVAVPMVMAAGLYCLVRVGTPERERERDPSRRTLTLQQGFSATIYVQGGMDNPTVITFDSGRRLYIGDISGSLWVAEDAERNGTAEALRHVADGFDLLVGLVWRENELYVASSGKIEAWRDSDGDQVVDLARTVVKDLPSLILRPHSNNGLTFGPDGRLYFGVGSTTDGQVEQNEFAAAILSVKPDGSDLRVYARGLGNSFDVAFNAEGELFAGDNSPSSEGDDPPDEFNHIVEDGHYGFPYFYGDPPDNGGTRGAIVSFPPHSVPTGATFYTGDQYPPEYLDSGFVALWSTGDIMRVEVGKAASGAYLGRAVPFASGFLYPIDVVTGPDGNLYVADFGTTAIYRITYDPNKAY